MASAAWNVTRHDEEVRIDLAETASFEEADKEAIIGALEEYITQDGVRTVGLGGSVLEVRPVPDNLRTFIGDVAGLVEGRGLRFYVGPI